MSALLTLPDFRGRFPEFRDLPDEQVTARLDDAARATPVDVWGELTASGHGWLTAHLLSSSSYGRDSSEATTTTYGRERARLEHLVGVVAAPRTT